MYNVLFGSNVYVPHIPAEDMCSQTRKVESGYHQNKVWQEYQCKIQDCVEYGVLRVQDKGGNIGVQENA